MGDFELGDRARIVAAPDVIGEITDLLPEQPGQVRFRPDGDEQEHQFHQGALEKI